MLARMVTRTANDVVALRSKVLFGNRHLLAVAAAVADQGPVVRARELEEGMGLPASTVHRSLATLVKAGLLRREPRERAEREQRYTRLPHPFWDAVRLLRDDVPAELGGASRGGRQ
jgi:DNA-binding MarR family transcriptional regulator